jgi:hypothetical protein
MSDTDDGRTRDGAYDDWLDAVADGEGYFLACANGHGWLPPRRVCPDCGSTELSAEPLPDAGTVETFTVVHVPAPSFAEDAPYATAVADFGEVRLTGVVRGVDPDEVGTGLTVAPDVDRRETDGERLLVLRPR